MKKKEILIIFILAVLTTAGSWLYRTHSEGCWSYGYPLKFLHKCFVRPLILEPLTIPSREVRWSLTSLAADLLFWLLAWGIVWLAVERLLKLEKAELIIRSLILVGGIVCLSSFLLPYSAPYARTPILFRLFKNLFTDFPRGAKDVLSGLVIQPQWILALIVIKGAYSGFSKVTYWLSLPLSMLIPIWTLWLSLLVSVIPICHVEPMTPLLGYYASIAGPIITFIGLILYKLESRERKPPSS